MNEDFLNTNYQTGKRSHNYSHNTIIISSYYYTLTTETSAITH